MSEKLSLIPQFNPGSSRAMDANKLKPHSESLYSLPETGDKFSKYLGKTPQDKPHSSDNKTETPLYQKKSPQETVSTSDTVQNKTQTTEQSSEPKAKDMSEKAEIAEDVENILNDPDLSIEEKIEALSVLPQFTDLSFKEKVDMLAIMLEDMPALKESFSAFFTNHDEAPLEATSLDADTEEATIHALEEDSATKEVVAVIQHIFKNDDKRASSEDAIETNMVTLDKAAQTTLLAADISEKFVQNTTSNDNNSLGDSDIVDEDAILEEHITDEAIAAETLVPSEKNTAIEAPKKEASLITDLGESKADTTLNTHLNANNNISGQQLNNTQNVIQRNNAEFKIATIPLKDNISMVITKAPESPNKIGINLEPAGMGEAELIIETKDNVVTAIVRAEKADILDMIRKETASLERHLKESGIDLGGGNLQFEQQNSNDNQNENAEKTTISAGFEENPMAQNVISEPQTIYQTLSSLDLSKGVDVRL